MANRCHLDYRLGLGQRDLRATTGSGSINPPTRVVAPLAPTSTNDPSEQFEFNCALIVVVKLHGQGLGASCT